MKNFTIVGQRFIAVAMFVFGVQQLLYMTFITRAFPPLPQWVPAQPLLAMILGMLLCATGLAIVFKFKARLFALSLAGLILLMFLLFLLPSLLMSPGNGFLWTNSGKALVLAGVNLIVAGSLPPVASQPRIITFLERLIPFGVCLLAGFFMLAATLHFIYVDFVAMLIPAWIPAHVFWTYFAAVALIAGAIGMLIQRTAQLAASLSAVMIFLWVILLHAPRALANLHDSNETTALFEALAMCGACILVAVKAAGRKNP